MYVLEELGLIEFVREADASIRPGSKALPRRYYRIKDGRMDDEAWQNPYAHLYPQPKQTNTPVLRKTVMVRP